MAGLGPVDGEVIAALEHDNARLQREVAQLQQELEQAKLTREAVMAAVYASNAEVSKFFKELWHAVRPKPGYFKRTIWFMWKPGEERTYALTRPPTEFWSTLQKREGFRLVSFDIWLPDESEAQRLGSEYVTEVEQAAP